MEWHNPKDYPISGKTIVIRFKDESEHEGHFIKNANKWVTNVNRYRTHDLGRQTFEPNEIAGWCYPENMLS